MTGEDVRQVFETIVPQQEIERLCARFGGIERQHKLHLGMLVRAMIISAGSPGRTHQADILRSYRECEVPKVARSACYRWFDEPLEHFMAALAQRARNSPGLASTRRSKCIKASPSAVGRRYATTSAPPGSMTAGIWRATPPGGAAA